MWNTMFEHPSDSYILGMLGFNFPTLSEALYYCVDTLRVPGIIRILTNAGISIPSEVMQAYLTINKI